MRFEDLSRCRREASSTSYRVDGRSRLPASLPGEGAVSCNCARVPAQLVVPAAAWSAGSARELHKLRRKRLLAAPGRFCVRGSDERGEKAPHAPSNSMSYNPHYKT